MKIKSILIVKSAGLTVFYTFGFLVQFSIIFIFGLYVSRLLPIYNIYISALACSIVFIGIGMFYRFKEWHDESRLIDSPWEISNSNYGATQIAQYAIFAFVINQIVMGAAGCIYKTLLHAKKTYEIIKSNNDELRHCITFLKNQLSKGQRFIKFSGITNDKSPYIVLINCNVAWTKYLDGELMIGLNRDYDNLTIN